MNEEIVHLVDDDEGLRRALSRLLQAEGYQVRAFASATEFLNACHAQEIGCLLLDVRLPELDGLELQRRLLRSGLTVPIVFLTGHGDIAMTVNAVKAGAIDFLTKPAEDADLLRAVRRALDHAASIREERNQILMIAAHFRELSPRERQVLEGVAAGKPNKVIASELGICEQTVKVHRGRVMEKMCVESLAELIHRYDLLNRRRKAPPTPPDDRWCGPETLEG